MKTNTTWYPIAEQGNYYKLEDDVLLSVPMMADGSMDMDGDEPNVVIVTEFSDTQHVLEMLRASA